MSNKRSVFFFLGSFKLGGTERTASRVGLELLSQGYKVKFILLYNIFDYDDKGLRDNSIILIPENKGSKFRKFISAYFTLLKLLRKHRPDYLISFSLLFNIFSFLTFYRKIVFRIESNIFIYKKKLHRRYVQKYISLSPNVKKVVIPSKGLYDACKQYFIAKNKLRLVSNPIDIEGVSSSAMLETNDWIENNKGQFIVSAGRLHASKGFYQLIKVFSGSLLVNDFKLIILGDGPEMEKLSKLVDDLDVKDRVILKGYVTNPYSYFINSRFFVLNSDHESFGNVIIEAMACGVPTLSNDCDYGPRSIIKHGVDGVLYNKHNEDEFKGWMEKLAYDESFYTTLKSRTGNSVKEFSIDQISKYWIRDVIN